MVERRRVSGHGIILHADDLCLAAGHLAYLALAVAQDRALFIPTELPDPKERDRLAAAAASVPRCLRYDADDNLNRAADDRESRPWAEAV